MAPAISASSASLSVSPLPTLLLLASVWLTVAVSPPSAGALFTGTSVMSLVCAVLVCAPMPSLLPSVTCQVRLRVLAEVVGSVSVLL